MRWKDAADEYCSIARTLGILGDRWTLLVVREAFSGVRRFDDFRSHLGIARNVLTDRLQRLVEASILEQRAYQTGPTRYEYRLTEAGRDLQSVLLSLMQWGDQWLAGEAGPPLLLEHTGCSHPIKAQLTCPHCNERLHTRNTQLRAGPGLPDEVAAGREAEIQRLQAQANKGTAAGDGKPPRRR